MITPKDIENKTMSPEKRKSAKNDYFAFYVGRPLSYILTIPFLYTNVMFNNDLKRIVVRGCDENDKDALRWCIAKPDKRKSRKMSCKPFAELVYKEMDWDSECR